MRGVTPSTTMVADTLLADAASPVRQHISLMHGWVPLTAQIVTGVVLLLAVGWRHRHWRLLWLPVAAVVGAGTSFAGKKLLSDVADDVADVAGWITPRLGGVGPMTRAMLLRNAVLAAEKVR